MEHWKVRVPVEENYIEFGILSVKIPNIKTIRKMLCSKHLLNDVTTDQQRSEAIKNIDSATPVPEINQGVYNYLAHNSFPKMIAVCKMVHFKKYGWNFDPNWETL